MKMCRMSAEGERSATPLWLVQLQHDTHAGMV